MSECRKVISSHVNSEGERIAVEEGALHGEVVEVLCIHDDPPPRGSGVVALMLLDESTRAWLQCVTRPEVPTEAGA